MTRRHFLFLLALAPAVRASHGSFLELSRELTGVADLNPTRAAEIYTSLRSPALDRLITEELRDETWALDAAEAVVNAWYSGPDSLAWSCLRGAGPPGVCTGARWWEAPCTT